jgi:hypothetical protein
MTPITKERLEKLIDLAYRSYDLDFINDKKETIDCYDPQELKSLCQFAIEAIELLEFYSNGGNPSQDMWLHDDLGHFTGKRCREFLSKWAAHE